MSLDTAVEISRKPSVTRWDDLLKLPHRPYALPPEGAILVSDLLGVQPNPGLGPATAFGEEPSQDLGPGARDWPACLRVINDAVLTRHRRATGSGVTHPERLSRGLDEVRQLGLNDTLSHLFFYESPNSNHSIVGDKFWGFRPSDTLSAPAYATRQLLTHSSGPNTDFQAESVSGDVRETLEMLAVITALGLYYPADGGPRCVSIVTGENGFQYLTIYDGRKYNVVVTAPGQANPWDLQSTYRALAQQAPVHRHHNNDYIVPPETTHAFPIRTAPTGNHFEDLHRLVRLIRLAATHPDIPERQLDIESARRGIAHEGEPQLDTVIRIMVNLAHALYVAPDKTLRLIDQTGLEKHLPNYSRYMGNILAHVMRHPGDQKLLRQFSTAQPLAEYLASAENELFPNFILHTASMPPSSNQFSNLRSFASAVAPLSPLEPNDFIRCVPPPDKRESIEPLLLNGQTISTDEGQALVARGIKILHELESRAVAQGNLEAAETIRNGRKFVEESRIFHRIHPGNGQP